MADFVKKENGLLFEDDFQENSLLWQLSPSDYSILERTEDGLRIKKNASYTTLSIREPSLDRYSCYCEIQHNPFDEKDIAGIALFSNAQDYAECQSCKMTIPSGYQNSESLKDLVLSLIDNSIDAKKYVKYQIGFDDTNDNIDFRTSSQIASQGETEWTEYCQRIMDEVLSKKYVKWNYDDLNSGTIQGENWEDVKDAANQSLLAFQDKNYKYIKFDKINAGYSFYASVDGVQWIEVGTTGFDGIVNIAFFTNGSNNPEVINNTDFVVKKIILHSNRYIKITGIKEDYKFKIMKAGEEIASSGSWGVQQNGESTYYIDTHKLTLPFSGDLYLYQDEAVVYHKSLENLYGGDELLFTYDLRVSVNNQEVFTDTLFELGTFIDNKQAFKIDLYNNESFDLRNVSIKVKAYSEYFSGADPIMIGVYDPNNISTEFKKELIIDKITSTQGVSLFITLDPKAVQNFYNNAESYRFKLVIG